MTFGKALGWLFKAAFWGLAAYAFLSAFDKYGDAAWFAVGGAAAWWTIYEKLCAIERTAVKTQEGVNRLEYRLWRQGPPLDDDD